MNQFPSSVAQNTVTKNDTLAYFKRRGSHVPAMDLLDFLNSRQEEPKFSLSTLQSAHWQKWQRTKEFDGLYLIFPHKWPPEDGKTLQDRKDTVEPDLVRLEEPAKEYLPPIEEKDIKIRELIQIHSPTVLGFLPIEEEEQKEILHLLKDRIEGDADALHHLLERHPAVTSYGCILAVSIFKEDKNFWNTFEEGLGVNMEGNTVRGQLSEGFFAAGKSLGLRMRQLEQDGRNDHVNLFLNQTGIILQWVPSLAEAVTSLEKQGLPRLDVEGTAKSFAAALAGKAHGQQNLQTFLEGPNGELLATVLLKAKAKDDLSMIPEHLREEIEKAFEEAGTKTRKDHIRPPRVLLDAVEADEDVESTADAEEEEEEVVPWLLLPKQLRRVADDSTSWIVKLPGEEPKNPFCHSDNNEPEYLPEGGTTVRLTNLKNVEDQEWEIAGWPTEGKPFKVYQEIGDNEQYELRLELHSKDDCGRKEVTLPFGSYKVLSLEGVEYREKDKWKGVGGKLPKKISFGPGSPEQVFRLGSDMWVFKSEEKPNCNVLFRREHNNFPVSALDEKILFGELADVWFYVPKLVGQTELDLSFSSGQMEKSVNVPLVEEEGSEGDGGEGAQVYWPKIKPILEGFLQSLSPGIHKVKITSPSLDGFEKEFSYWKDLRYHTLGKFKCKAVPEGFNTNWKGLSKAGTNLIYDAIQGTSNIFAFREGERIQIAKAGVFPRVEESGSLPFHLLEYDHLEIFENDKRKIVFETADSSRWELHVQINGKKKKIKGSLKKSLALIKLATSHSDYNEVWIEDSKGIESPRKLFSYSVIRAGRLRYEPQEGKARIVLPSQIHELKFVILDLLWEGDGTGADNLCTEQVFSVEQLKSSLKRSFSCPRSGEFKVSVSKPNNIGKWELNIEWPETFSTCSIYILEVLFKEPSDKDWKPLKLYETKGIPSEARFLIPDKDLERPSEMHSNWKQFLLNAWHDVRGPSCIEIQKPSKNETFSWFRRFQSHLSIKYHSKVWSEYGNRIGRAYSQFCQTSFDAQDRGIKEVFAEAAVRGLNQRSQANFNDQSINSYLAFALNPSVLVLPAISYQNLAEDTPCSPVHSVFLAIGRIGRDRPDQPAIRLDGEVGEPAMDPAKGMPISLYNVPFILGLQSLQAFGGKFGPDWEPSEGNAIDAGLNYFRNRLEDACFENLIFDEDSILLSPSHCGMALRSLSRRCSRLFENSSQRSALNNMRQDIKGISGQRAETVAKLILKTIWEADPSREPSGFRPPLPWQESSINYQLGYSIFLLAGLATLVSADKMEMEEYQTALDKWLPEEEGDVSQRQTLCLLLSQGPEWFALCRLLWEIVNLIK